MPGITQYPPFPAGVPTHPLLVINYALVKERDVAELRRLWDADTKLGFWYLKNHGVEDEVEGMFAMGADTMTLPMEEKMQFEQGDEGCSFGYKAAGANAVDESGARDTIEFINIAKDDALAWPLKVHRGYPRTVNEYMESTIKPFVDKSLEVNNTLIDVFNDMLGLPKGALLNKHPKFKPSGSEARCIKNPARSSSGGEPSQKTAIGAHTDFGSLSFLHNRLGGLQVMPPGSKQWYYIKPLPGHAICNLGDAMSIFSGGILRSNLHRVVTPPKDQANYERWSLVFFTRPADDVELTALTEESAMIADTVKRSTDPSLYLTRQTARDWFSRRIKYQRIKNRMGPETWLASRGTEHAEIV